MRTLAAVWLVFWFGTVAIGAALRSDHNPTGPVVVSLTGIFAATYLWLVP